MCLSTHALAYKVHTMTHIVQLVNALHLKYVCLIASKIGIGLYGSSNRIQIGSFLQFHVDHTTVNTLTNRNSHTESILDTFLTTDTYAMSHTTSWAEVGICNTLGGQTLHKCTDNAVRTWIPTSTDDTYGTCLLCCSIKATTQVTDKTVNIKTIYCIDTQSQALESIFFYTTCRSSQNGNINLT